MALQSDDLGTKRTRLQQWLVSKLPGAQNLSLSELKKPGAGLSNETLLFTLSWTDGGRTRSQYMVVRLQPAAFHVFPDYDLTVQYRIMQALGPTAIPVPRVRWLEADPVILGCPFYVMDAIAGQVPSDVPPYHTFGCLVDAAPEQRARMWWHGVDTLARIHALDWQRLGLSFLGVPPPGTGPVDQVLDYQERYLHWACGDRPHPLLPAALEWLKHHRFAPKRVGLCWGDARLGNVIYQGAQIAGLLDWEMSFLGDPEADLMWWLYVDWMMSEGYGIPRLAGLPSREETIGHYEELTGTKVEHPLYHEVLAAFYNSIIFFRLAARMEAMGVPTPTPDFATNNVNSQALARLLGLPPPGAASRHEVIRLEDVTRRVQFRLTGSGGSDWYLIVDRGQPTRHQGTVANPDVTVTVSASDWSAIQRGELNRLQAYYAGKIQTEGDLTLFMQLEDVIAKLGR